MKKTICAAVAVACMLGVSAWADNQTSPAAMKSDWSTHLDADRIDADVIAMAGEIHQMHVMLTDMQAKIDAMQAAQQPTFHSVAEPRSHE